MPKPKVAVCPPHAFKDDVCFVCGITFVEHVKGFGIGGFSTKSPRKRTLKSLSG